MLVMLFLVSALTFVMFVRLPSGDPTLRFVGQQTSPQALADARKAYGLDKPWYVQYWRLARGMIPLPGTFLDKRVYYSYASGVPVREELARRAGVSAVLAGGATVLWLWISLWAGMISAKRAREPADRAILATSLLFISVPAFTAAYLLLYVFWYKLHVAPPSGLPAGESLLDSVLSGRFVLPWIALALFPLALYARMTRSHVLEGLRSDRIRTARAKGLPEHVVLSRHALRGAAVPLSTMVAVDFAALLGGSAVIETVFNLPGLGQYAVQATRSGDIPSVMGLTVFTALCVLVANLVVDILYAALDPRIRRP